MPLREGCKQIMQDDDDYKSQYKKFTPEVEPEVTWNEAKTLEEYAISLFEKGIVNGPIIDTLIAFYGREKFIAFYKKWKETKK